MISRLIGGFVIVTFTVVPSYGQLVPETAQAHLYFPQFVDGGPMSGQLQTTFTFANSYSSAVSVTLYLMTNDGRPLLMDFMTNITPLVIDLQSGAISFSIPP